MCPTKQSLIQTRLFWISFHCLTCLNTVIFVLLRVPIKCIYVSLCGFVLFGLLLVVLELLYFVFSFWLLLTSLVSLCGSCLPLVWVTRIAGFRCTTIVSRASWPRVSGWLLSVRLDYTFRLTQARRVCFYLRTTDLCEIPWETPHFCYFTVELCPQIFMGFAKKLRIFGICVSSSCGSWPVRTRIMLWSMSFGWCSSCIYFRQVNFNDKKSRVDLRLEPMTLCLT